MPIKNPLETLTLKPVQQPHNPFIQNEADRIFIPNDEPLIRIARSLGEYSATLAKEADRREADLAEKGLQQAQEAVYQSGGLDNLKQQYFDNPNLDGVNPYFYRELGKEVLKIKGLQLNSDMKLAFEKENWSALSPAEFQDKLLNFLGEWRQANYEDLKMVDSRDYTEVFDKVSDETTKVVTENYYQNKAADNRAKREYLFQETMSTDIEAVYGDLDKLNISLYRNTNYNNEPNFDPYKDLKGNLINTSLHQSVVKNIRHYIDDLHMGEREAVNLAFKVLKNWAVSTDGAEDVFIAEASLLNDEFKFVDSATFSAWAEETRTGAVDAYNKRQMEDVKKAAITDQYNKLDIDKKFSSLTKKDFMNLTPEQFMETNNISKKYSSYVVDVFNAYSNAQSAPITPKTAEQQDNYNSFVYKIHMGTVSPDDLLAAASSRNIFAHDYPSLMSLYTSVQERGGGVSKEGKLLLEFEPEIRRMIAAKDGISNMGAWNAEKYVKVKVMDIITYYMNENDGKMPSKEYLESKLVDIVNNAVAYVPSDKFRNPQEYPIMQMDYFHNEANSGKKPFTISLPELLEIRDPKAFSDFKNQLYITFGYKFSDYDALQFAFDAAYKGLEIKGQNKFEDDRRFIFDNLDIGEKKLNLSKGDN